MESGLQNNLFGRVALRLIESRGGLGLTEDIHHPVIADAVARAKVRMRIVVKRAPSNATRILRIGRQLIMNPCVAQSMLTLPFVVVGRLGWKCVPDELRVEVSRMIRLLKRKPEVVHGEYVFEELRLLEVAYSSRLPSRIE